MVTEGEVIRALRALRLIDGADVVRKTIAPGGGASGGYWGPYPIRTHRTMAQVLADEAAGGAQVMADEAELARSRSPEGR